jgi:Mrp family chromosome partitioning ATPase
MTGAVLLVVDARRRDFDDIERAIGELRSKGSNVLGVVINRSRHSRRRRKAYAYYQSTPVPIARRGPSKDDSAEILPASVPSDTGPVG